MPNPVASQLRRVSKAAALLCSIDRDQGLLDGNKRLGWVATRLFYLLNNRDLHAPHDQAYDLVVTIADGSLSDVAKIAAALARWVRRLAGAPTMITVWAG